MKTLFIIVIGLLNSGYGTPSSHCEKDQQELCKSSEETKTNCLQTNYDKIKSAPCKKELDETRSNWQKKTASFEKVQKQCEADGKKFCPEDSKTRKNLKVCIMMNSDKITANCKTELNRHIKEFLPGINPLK